MQNPDQKPDRGPKMVDYITSEKVCKTFIHRFDSDPRLQHKSQVNQQVSLSDSSFSIGSEGIRKPDNSRKNGEGLANSLTPSLTGSREKPDAALDRSRGCEVSKRRTPAQLDAMRPLLTKSDGGAR